MLLSVYTALGLAATACGRALQVPIDSRLSTWAEPQDLELDLGTLSLKISFKDTHATNPIDKDNISGSDNGLKWDEIKDEVLGLIPDITQAVGFAESISTYDYMKPSFKLQKLLLDIAESHNSAADNINGSSKVEDKSQVTQLADTFLTSIVGNSTNLIEKISDKTSLIKQAGLNRFKILNNLEGHKDSIKALGKALSTVIPNKNDDIKKAYVKLRDQYIKVIEELGESDTEADDWS